jgi:predicted alpha/beta-fold hydrolase
MLLLTKAGGHVGWPLGSNPKKYAWKWMSNAVRDFALAVNMARKELNE